MSHSLVHQGNHPIIGVFKLIMHDFLPKSVLTTPNKSYVLPVLGNSSFPSTEMKLTSLYSHGSFFSLFFLKIGGEFALIQSSVRSPSCHNYTGLAKVSGHSLSICGTNPSGSMGLSYWKCFLNLVFLHTE